MSKSTKPKSRGGDDDFRQSKKPANQSSVDQPYSSKLIKSEVSPSQIDAGSGKLSHSRGSTKTMLDKIKENEPYNIFFTTIPDVPETINQKNSITFTDLLCPSLGELKCSLQLTFLLSTKWLMEQYEEQGQGKKPLVVLYGEENKKEEKTLPLPNVEKYEVNMKDQYGKHHAKIGIYVYEDNSVRVVVSTANLYYNDWNHYNQGLWISPLCSVLPEDAAEAGESPTGFKRALIKYLEEYKMPVLNNWITYVKRADFSAVKVFLITSAPGDYKLSSLMQHYPLLQVEKILSKYCKFPENKGEDREWDIIIAQASSFGSLGDTQDVWLKNMLLKHFASHENQDINPEANIRIVYPTQNNVRGSHFGEEGGKCMAYSNTQHEKQKWLENVLHQWKADRTQRTGIMPHIKTYCRVSKCQTKLAWFLLTSANISKAAWGYPYGGNIKVLSYEVGVLFLPQLFEKNDFQIKNDSEDKSHLFPFMYDLPLCPYDQVDKPYTVNY